MSMAGEQLKLRETNDSHLQDDQSSVIILNPHQGEMKSTNG